MWICFLKLGDCTSVVQFNILVVINRSIDWLEHKESHGLLITFHWINWFQTLGSTFDL